MPFRDYIIWCDRPGCPNQAVYKVAARWSDGLVDELKTYSLCCADCLDDRLILARTKQAQARLAPGETLDPPAVYRLRRGARDRELERL
ncbi:MAG: hypothetical protein N2039_16070 [Gemmataceae bacterium]|nr:hypothetical protein [Gemmataceae bacterium]